MVVVSAIGEASTTMILTAIDAGARRSRTMVVSASGRRDFHHRAFAWPALNRAGVTIVAISHDDRYIEQMDIRIHKLHMDERRLFKQTAAENG